MKTWKQLAALALCLALICSLLPGLSLTAHAETLYGNCGAEGDGSHLTWSFDEETGVLTISGSGAMNDFGYVHQKPWNSVCDRITAVTLPDGLTRIGSEAFSGCIGLTSITLPENIISIGDLAFDGCSKLADITFPACLRIIENSAFNDCSGLTSLVLPEGLEDIFPYAFRDCTGLTKLQLPSHLKILSPYCFTGCTALREVILPISLCWIGEGAFSDCAEGFTVYGVKGSKAEGYANAEGFPFVPVQVKCPFSDVTETDYFYAPVLWAAANNITVGVGNGLFGSDQPCTREQIVTFLWKTCGSPEPQGTESKFSDVANDDYFFKAVLWAEENQITAGIGNGLFGVGVECTRAQAMTFLWTTAGKPRPETAELSFTDVSDSDAWYYNPVLWAAENGITAGIGNNLFGVENVCTRSQCVTFLYKAIDVPVKIELPLFG